MRRAIADSIVTDAGDTSAIVVCAETGHSAQVGLNWDSFDGGSQNTENMATN